MDKTINKICMVFQGLGKTYVKTHEDELGIHVEDFDFKKFDHSNPEWFTDYTKELSKLYSDNSINYIFCNISADLIKFCTDSGFQYTIISPVFDKESNTDEYRRIKEILFGRYVLRKTQTEKNVHWIEHMKMNFDHWTCKSFFEDLDCLHHVIPVQSSKMELEKYLK